MVSERSTHGINGRVERVASGQVTSGKQGQPRVAESCRVTS